MPRKPNSLDAVLLSVFVALVTFQPYFLHGRLNLFEFGIYLPGIEAVLDGRVPYRDFFYLRGPFELYMPAALMAVFGRNVAVLSTYFYVGNVLALIMCVWIAKELYRSRLFFYVMVPVLAARTFPRVVFTYWGGMRYVLGLTVVLCLVKFMRTRRLFWSVAAGLSGGLSLMTSVEIGVCVFFAAGCIFILACFFNRSMDRRFLGKAILVFLGGASLVLGAFAIYMVRTDSLLPFLESVYAVVFKSHPTFATHLTSSSPRTLPQFLLAMMPWDRNFKYMTPMYLYLMIVAYFAVKLRRGKLDEEDSGVIAVAGYGFVLYLAAFRIIEGGQFETALQVEKILLFFLLERVHAYLGSLSPAIAGVGSARNIWQRHAAGIFLLMFMLSSMGYSLQRYNHRFPVFHAARAVFSGKRIDAVKPLKDEPSRSLGIPRAWGMVVPLAQAEELEAVAGFIQDRTSAGDPVFTYPDLGAYSFLIERPPIGRFPIVCFTWMNETWHRELMGQLKTQKPKYAILTRELDKDFTDVYFTSGHNREYHREVVDYIEAAYMLELRTVKSDIYRLKSIDSGERD